MKEDRSESIIHGISRFNLLTSLLSLLNQNDDDDTDFVIARYFLVHLRELHSISIYKIAADCYVSRSSVQRFIKKIGYDSYTQLKSNLNEIIEHEDGFKAYTDFTDYRIHLMESLDAMGADIEKTTRTPAFFRLLDIFNSARRVTILTAEDSSHACKLFQQQILTTGKLIRIVSSANKNISLLNTLNEEDLLLVCSVTGNYALAINDQIAPLKVRKCLITVNRTTAFEDTYSFIYYLSSQHKLSTRSLTSVRNVYNNYGLTFFFDIFYHECFVAYNRNKKDLHH